MSYQSRHAMTRAVRSLSRKTKAVVLVSALAGTGAWMTAVAGSASAAKTAPVRNSVSAGYAAGNIFGPVNLRTSNTWRFRYASATTRLPNPLSPLNVSGDTMNAVNKFSGFAVHLANFKQTIVLGISWNQNSTTPRWNVNVAQEYKAGGIGYNCNAPVNSQKGTNCSNGTGWANGNQFRPGATVRLDLYYNRNQGSIEWTVYQNGIKVADDAFAAWTPQSAGGGAFTEAFAGGDFSTSAYASALSPNNFMRPDARARLFAVRATHFTSYNGTKGTVAGPWVYSQLQVGTSARNVYASAPVLWNGGRNFGVWLLP